MAHRQMSASEFKATCPAVLDEVNEHGGSVSITKRRKPVATLQVAENPAWKSLKNALRDQIRITGDIVYFNTAGDWEAFQLKAPSQKTKGSKRRGPGAV
jgi:antitoxin (DNA-binding transcriptional repressor) of toxin-antitoxin stability system